MKRKFHSAVFLDRDGTLINEPGFLRDPNGLKFYPHIGPALASLTRAGFKLVMISNQSGVARGYFTVKTLMKIQRRLSAFFKKHGARIDGFYFCPHMPDAGCACRKPKPGMGRRAARKFHLDLKRSYMVGDQYRDIEFAKNLGVKGVLVLTGYGRVSLPKGRRIAAKVSSSTVTACRWILKDSGHV
jgi:histidinol-phosphate phosphatase family protein